MVDVARHIRIFDKDPSDDLVSKRASTIAMMAEAFLKLKSYDDYFQVAEDIAWALEDENLRAPDDRAVAVEEAIRAQSPAFDREGQDLQILTCLMLAVLKAIKSGQPSATAWSRTEIVGASIWLALGTQTPRKEPKVEALRTEIVDAARSLITRAAEGSRARSPIPDPAVKVAELSEPTKVAESVNKGLLKSIDALRQNAALDREELDMMWWALGDWSALQQQHLQELPMQVVAVTAGIEASKLLRRLPSEGHKHIVLRRVIDDSERSAVELVTSLGDSAGPIRAAYSQEHYVNKFPHVFRLLAAISGDNIKTQLLGNRSWGAVAMLEATVLRLTQNNTMVL